MSPISSPVRNCYKKILGKDSDNRVVNDFKQSDEEAKIFQVF